jgi:hypothetical protein
VRVISILERGSNDEKLYFYFKLFDFNNDGLLESDELQVLAEVMQESYSIVSSSSSSLYFFHYPLPPSLIHFGIAQMTHTNDQQANDAIQVLLDDIVAEMDVAPEGGIKVGEILKNKKLVRLWELLRILNVDPAK